jgi:hypothetical protein
MAHFLRFVSSFRKTPRFITDVQDKSWTPDEIDVQDKSWTPEDFGLPADALLAID